MWSGQSLTGAEAPGVGPELRSSPGAPQPASTAATAAVTSNAQAARARRGADMVDNGGMIPSKPSRGADGGVVPKHGRRAAAVVLLHNLASTAIPDI
ncbi:hypothetical protein GCM10012280_18160 [Wenjunlia tyrosinilytica]|uniref:Uncharacterized protein n=1 Tax=Wenjunlia tyrosinilytica TaxID=1544741 RepID=A0A918DVZ1_9ACTN|nr:hypothetical protein GCM10012280_18160 [Wenjunlia tyrosinilytica]